MMNKYTIVLILLCIDLIINTGVTTSQISSGGEPPSFSITLKSVESIPLFTLPQVNNDLLNVEDETTTSTCDCEYRVAKGFAVDLTPENSGTWEEIPGSGRIWRLRIMSPGAFGLSIIFERYYLPQGAKLFLYSSDRKQLLGAFTSMNNKSYGKLAIAPVAGDELIIEFFEPVGITGQFDIQVGNIGHIYRENVLFSANGFGDAQKCNKDVNCPVASDWQKEKRSVCMIIFQKMNGNYYLCTGALINNARNDGTPYFLTANHCLPTYYEAQHAVYYFNYESPSCGGPDGSMSQSISGANIVATVYALDFCLVKLSSKPPASYQPYYSGWDATTSPPTSSVCIHHPVGDVKKISVFNKTAQTGDFIYEFDYNDRTHWFIDRWSQGITEGGSSGSPLYNQDHRIVGDLTGGSIVGNCTSSDGYFAKISHSWADYSQIEAQLKHWLDPDNSGVTYIDGIEPPETGISENSPTGPQLSVYPNPAQGIIYVEFDSYFSETFNIIMFDAAGRVVLRSDNPEKKGKIQLNVSDLLPGVYFLKIVGERNSYSEKIILL